MNLQQFAALQVGDIIDNHMSASSGVVTKADETGVRVRWGGMNAPDWHYGVNSTAWFHWSRVIEVADPAGGRA